MTGRGGHRERFLEAFPNALRLEKTLQSNNNRTPLFYFLESSDEDLRGCWIVVGRLGTEIEGQFSITSEVVILFSPYADLQRRSFNALTERVREELASQQRERFGYVRFTPDPRISLIWSEDPRAEEKLEDWNASQAQSLVALVPPLASDVIDAREELLKAIGGVLTRRDLYRGRNPVFGEDFFGRSSLLQQLGSELRAGQSLGLFGLRRSGKTSVLRELRRRREGGGLCLVLSDLEAASSLEEMVEQISSDLLVALYRQQTHLDSVWLGSESDHIASSFSELSSRLKRVAEKNPSLKFVVAIDEIESLASFVESDPAEVRRFLGALRSSAQAAKNVSLLFTGVTRSFFTESMLGGSVDNPLFGFVDPVYLRPFEEAETGQLLKSLGAKMLLHWEDDAVAEVHSRTGGFPFLVRDLASEVRGLAEESRPHGSIERIAISSQLVSEAEPVWRSRARDMWLEIVKTLEIYHEMMAELLRSDDKEIDDWMRTGGDAVTAASALAKLGLLETAGDSFHRSSSLRALQALQSSAEADATDVKRQQTRARSIRQTLSEPEGQTLEFKETARWNVYTKDRDPRVEDAVLKTVAAFLNTDGGRLILGVSDAGDLMGLRRDLKLFNGSQDAFENWLMGSLLSDLCGAEVIAHCVSFELVNVDGKEVGVLEIDRSNKPIWVSGSSFEEVFFVRTGNSTRSLAGREQYDFIRNRWPNT